MENDLEIFKKQIDAAVELKTVEDNLKQLEQIEPQYKHHFAGGIYARELFIPRDSVAIGKRHRHASFNFLLSGELSLYVGPGLPSKRIKGPFVFESAPYTRKMVYTHTDVIFMNFHPTNEIDLEKIEAEFIISEEEYIEQKILECNQKNEEDIRCLGQP